MSPCTWLTRLDNTRELIGSIGFAPPPKPGWIRTPRVRSIKLGFHKLQSFSHHVHAEILWSQHAAALPLARHSVPRVSLGSYWSYGTRKETVLYVVYKEVSSSLPLVPSGPFCLSCASEGAVSKGEAGVSKLWSREKFPLFQEGHLFICGLSDSSMHTVPFISCPAVGLWKQPYKAEDHFLTEVTGPGRAIFLNFVYI